MNKKTFTYLVVFILSTNLTLLNAQVDEIKEKSSKSEQNKRESRSSTPGDHPSHYDDDDDDESFSGCLAGCAGDIIGYILLELISGAQQAVLDQKEAYPHVSSLEMKYTTGFSPQHNALQLVPEIEGNWGLISTDLRFFSLQDYTGDLNSFDWQVFKLNIPVKNFKLSGGIGFSHAFNPSVDLTEGTLGMELHMARGKIVLSGEYRGSGSDNITSYRKEFSVQLDYRTRQWKRLQLSPMAGFRYQVYYNQFEYYSVHAGLALRLY